MIYAVSATLSAKRALRAAFEPARWVDENETYVEFEAQGGCPPLITLICRSGKRHYRTVKVSPFFLWRFFNRTACIR